MASPNLGTRDDELSSISAISATDIWAVGTYNMKNTARATRAKTLTMHWDGLQWTVVASPNPSPYSRFSAVSAADTDQAWAVGTFVDSAGWHTLTERWDGTTWETVSSPDAVSSAFTWLADVDARASDDATAVGFSYSFTQHPVARAIIERWDGTRWIRS